EQINRTTQFSFFMAPSVPFFRFWSRGGGGENWVESCAAGLPDPGILHRCPRFSGRSRIAHLQELDRDLIGCANERHVSVPGGAKDDDPHLLQMSARLVYILDGERE